MKTIIATLAALTLGLSAAQAKTLEITVDGIRNDRGNILVMAQAAGQEKPVYGMAAARKGAVTVTLAGIDAASVEVSLFHDEDGDYRMKTGDRGPLEGYATRTCKLPAEKNAAKALLYYPDSEN